MTGPLLRFHILTLFPEMFQSPLGQSILKRAIDRGLVQIKLHNLRDFTHDRHSTVDDAPYGGGAGMVLMPGPVFEGVESIKNGIEAEKGAQAAAETPVILMDPQGRLFNQEVAGELSQRQELILVCGHYEGVDERVRLYLATHELSIGDYVLTGGELPAMVVVDAVARLVPGVLHNMEAARDDSFSESLLQHPQYTRPAAFRGWPVPEVLLSGNHGEIAAWRRRQALLRTRERRPDLLARAPLTEEERRALGSGGPESAS
ncbi:MAG: tRNA (guanosine(37)-N1)-methyltransferase TrmD [Chloroflexi bacterium]|nr:tRNA (guanosine(37)-N1)-methyltransferase TrmD [Chloroflexota bacterium]